MLNASVAPGSPVQRAIELLSGVIAEARRRSTSRLPPLRELAVRAGVSVSSMQAAVGAARERGEVRVVGRHGVYVSAPAGTGPDLRTADARVQRALCSDIASGRFPRELPPVKLLAQRYRCGQRTVSVAVRQLALDGLVYRQARGRHAVAAPSPARMDAVVVFVSAGDAAGRIVLFNDRVREAVSAMHAYSADSERSVIFLSASRTSAPADLRARLKDLLRTRGVLGVLVWANGLTRAHVDQACGALSDAMVPSSLIDEQGEYTAEGVWPWRTVFSIAAERAGAGIARHLYLLGHRRVAYHHAPGIPAWSQRRCEGLRAFFARMGQPGAVNEYGTPAATPPPPPTGTDLDIPRQILAMLSAPSVRGVPTRQLRELLVDDTRRAAAGWMQFAQTSAQLNRQFHEASASRATSAWVAANDFTAGHALHFLSERAIGVPARVSLTGMDDERIAEELDLTSYNFAIRDLTSRALHNVLHPGDMRTRTWPVVESEGFVAVRGSTGAAAG